ncbi:ArsR/SmtB family transcription factor [Streptomyces sp. NPDC056254]|uniref:ArsR/SmtB family transcription factor n=1 Tax=unclassified Streptomyces TaxID=2593676 RepID=UPI0004AAF77E|nr:MULTISPECIES: helix-turn-helix transcriptional regulator [unclassified Streptomyces]APU41327.1 ArsR family transcriptional regulator [Streptomyces sp. TN58]KJK54556.1 ArsR family transcriptional regulator [Streptomyces sp. NRRL F-4428]
MPDEDGHPSIEEMSLPAVLSALADPLRYAVVSALLKEPEGTARTCASFNLPVSKSTITHHFKVLRQAGLVGQVDRGNSRAATLRRAELDERFPGLLDLIRANS